jgi:hypothetical protein
LAKGKGKREEGREKFSNQPVYCYIKGKGKREEKNFLINPFTAIYLI